MRFLLWTAEAKDEAVDLGDPFSLIGAFVEMARLTSDFSSWEELFSVPEFGAQAVEVAWLEKVSSQAEAFREKYHDKLGGQSLWILEQLIEGNSHVRSR